MGSPSRRSGVMYHVRRGNHAEVFAALMARTAFLMMRRPRAVRALFEMAEKTLADGETAIAEALYRKAAEAGHHGAVVRLVNWPGIREYRALVEAVYRAAIAAGDVQSLSGLASARARQGDKSEARALYLRAIESGDVAALTGYMAFLSNHGEPGELDQAIERCRQRVAEGETAALALLGALLLSDPETKSESEAVLRRGRALLDNRCRCLLAALLLDRGDVEEATNLIQRVLATGDVQARLYIGRLAEEYDLPF